MARLPVDKEVKKKILDSRRMIQAAEKADCNEAETRRRIERIFETLMGYNVLEHLTREHAIRGAGETEHADFTIQLETGEKARPEVIVEIKRVSFNLAPKHLKQVASYAINEGCEWILLTNAKDWRLYHVTFGQPPITKLIHSWNIITDDVATNARCFELISYKNVRKKGLDKLWKKTNILHPRNLLQAILSISSLKAIKREIKKDSDVLLSPEDIISGIRRLLNETALTELENINITIPERKKRKKERKSVSSAPSQPEADKNNISEIPS